MRLLKAMVGTGFAFSAIATAVAMLVTAVGFVVSGGELPDEALILIVGSAIWSFPIGVVVAGCLALVARGRSFSRLSLPMFAGMGAVAGLLLFGVFGLLAGDVLTARSALANLAVFVGLGTTASSATLLIARSAEERLGGGDGPPLLDDG
jgi:hypothetical protein